MSGEIDITTLFGKATTQGIDSSAAVELPGQSATRRVRSLLFDGLRLQAGSGQALEVWRVEVLSLPLINPSRRRVRLTLRGQFAVAQKGLARVSLGCESRHVSAALTCRDAPSTPDGGPPARIQPLFLSLVLARSVRPRTLIRISILIEAEVQTALAQADAAVDSIEVEAL